jgi:hypothetical protein
LRQHGVKGLLVGSGQGNVEGASGQLQFLRGWPSPMGWVARSATRGFSLTSVKGSGYKPILRGAKGGWPSPTGWVARSATRGSSLTSVKGSGYKPTLRGAEGGWPSPPGWVARSATRRSTLRRVEGSGLE